MADETRRLAGLPQRHFLGGKDKTVPRGVYDSYASKMGKTPCLHMTEIIDADHEHGWVERWPALLQEPLECGIASPDTTVPAPAPAAPGQNDLPAPPPMF